MINNMSPGFLPNGSIDAATIKTGKKVPPSSLRTIGDALNDKGISCAYYGGGFNAAVRVANGSTDPLDILRATNYCDICDTFSYTKSIMDDPAQRAAHIKDAIDFFATLDKGKLPSVAYVKPDSIVGGHPPAPPSTCSRPWSRTSSTSSRQIRTCSRKRRCSSPSTKAA
ncbi:MAG TPA: alkaline phosphatase family protein, partial [Xanthobacteraceae bacterium]|nr:alkaline phosphatase family protein [Xanthobacteraceae bacterium]